MKRRPFFLTLRFFVYSALALLALSAAGVQYIDRAMNGERFRSTLEKGLSVFLQRQVTIEKLEWHWFPLPHLTGENVQLVENNGHRFASAKRIYAFIKLEPLTRRKIDIGRLSFSQPEFLFIRNKHGQLNVATIVEDIKRHNMKDAQLRTSSLDFVLREIQIHNATIRLVDATVKKQPLDPVFHADATFNFGFDQEPVRFEVNGTMTKRNKNARFTVFGEFAEETTLRFLSSSLPVRFGAEYAPLLNRIEGETSMNAALRISEENLSWRVQATATKLSFVDYPDLPSFAADFDIRSDSDSRIQLMVTSTGTAAKADLRIADFQSKEVQADITSEWSDIDQLAYIFKTVKSLTSVQVSSAAAEDGRWSGSVHLEAKNIQFKNEAIDLLRTDATVEKNGDVIVEKYDATGLGGQAKGSALIKNGEFQCRWNAEGVEMRRLEKFLGLKPISTGKLASQGLLSGSTVSLRSPQLNGEFDASLTNGVVVGVPGLLKTLASFNLKSLVKKVEGQKSQGMPFKSASGRFLISNGIVETKGAAMLQNDTLQVAVMGKVNLVDSTVNGDMIFYFLTVLDEAISAIPGVRAVLLGGKKSMVPTWVHVSGSIDDPQIETLPAKTLTDTAWSTIRNVFNLPHRVLRTFIRSKDATTPTKPAP